MLSLGFIHSSQFLNLWHEKIYRECLLTRILICQVVKLQGQIVKKNGTRDLKSKNHPNISTRRKFITSILKFTTEAFLLYIFTWLRSNYRDHILNEGQQRNTQLLHGRPFIGTVPGKLAPKVINVGLKEGDHSSSSSAKKMTKILLFAKYERKKLFCLAIFPALYPLPINSLVALSKYCRITAITVSSGFQTRE